jgi:hypothetical protein
MSQLCFKTVRATFAAHGSSGMCPLSQVSVWLAQIAQTTRDLTFRASPLQGIAPSRFRAGSSAFLALLLLITYTSPSSRQPILDITPGLCFLRNPSPYAMRLAPAPVVPDFSERTDGVTPFPVSMVRIPRAVLSTGLLWQCQPVSVEGCRRRILCRFGSSASASCAGWPSRWLNTPLLTLPLDACWTGDPDRGCQAPPFSPASDR